MKKAIEIVSQKEKKSIDFIEDGVKKGSIVILQNRKHNIEPVGIGAGLRVKVNTNIGSSPEHMDIREEIDKLKTAIEAGTDTVMDLSVGKIMDEVRQEVLKHSTVPVGTVPIYQICDEISRKKKTVAEITIDDCLRVIEKQAEEGIDFMTLHCGVTKSAIEKLFKEGRILDIVSRGGAILTQWIKRNNKENLLYVHYDKILEILKEYNVAISLGDGIRPGSVVDATDRGQVEELIVLGELTQRAWEMGVPVIIEGPGHVPLNQIEANVLLEKKLCHNAPFYVLGPLVCDIASSYDHIAGAIGGALAAYFGADFLCYVTPAEHLRLPTVADVKEGVIASRIAAHCADLARGNIDALEWDRQISEARKKLDWSRQLELSIDPARAKKFRNESEAKDKDICTMCGEFCAIKKINEI